MPDLDADTNEARSRDREVLVEKKRSDASRYTSSLFCVSFDDTAMSRCS